MRNVRNTAPSGPQTEKPFNQQPNEKYVGSIKPQEPPKNINFEGPPPGFDPNKVEYPWNPLTDSRMDKANHIEAPVTPAHRARDLPLR